MIPRNLRIRNFLCYGEDLEPICLDSVHVACLTGDNGHGKTALIDAMTWSLWGRSRAKSDDDLIHMGRSEMEVEFDFALDGVDYRVVRKRQLPKSRKAAGSTLLELMVDQGGTFRVMSGNSVRETEQVIIDLLRMDYDTFINSAFLRQGRADEFTIKPPSDRKRVLADILGLGAYDRLESRAKKHVQEFEIALERLQTEIAGWERALAHRAEYQAALDEATEALTIVQRDLTLAEASARELRLHKSQFDRARQDLEGVARQLIRAQDARDRSEREVARLREEQAGHQAMLGRAAEIELGYQELGEVRRGLAALTTVAGRKIAIQQEQVELKEIADQELGRLKTAFALQEAALSSAQAAASTLDELISEIEQLDSRHQAAALLLRELDATQRVLTELEQERAALEGANQQLKAEMKEIEANRNLIRASGACPVCRRELGHDARSHLVEQYQAEGTSRGERFRENKRRIDELIAQVASCKTKLSARPEAEGAERRLDREQSALESRAAEATRARQKLTDLEPPVAALARQLERKDYAHAERARYRQLQDELEMLGYDAGRYASLQIRELELAEFETLSRRIAAAGEASTQISRALESETQRHKTCLADLEEHTQRAAKLTAELAGADAVEQSLKEAEDAADELSKQRFHLRDQASVARQKLEECARLDQQLKEGRGNERGLRDELALYSELARAFGKKGVPAMLIEAVIPEIESEANDLLHRMTDGRMTVRLETQRDNRRGDQIETLDIRIADELGTRNYEMYSGGEGFRVNFALRIALSRLLARRAGSRLQTLIVDEGFGGLDQAGRDKLVEVINAVRHDFEKILIITHLDDLKDAFDTRIEVTKTESGSRVAIFG